MHWQNFIEPVKMRLKCQLISLTSIWRANIAILRVGARFGPWKEKIHKVKTPVVWEVFPGALSQLLSLAELHVGFSYRIPK